MEKLDGVREKIDLIDREMLKLFEERMGCSRKIAEYKRDKALPVKDLKRERELIQKNRELLEDKEIEGYYVDFLKKIIELSCEYQDRLLSGSSS